MESHTTNEDFRLELVAIFALVIFLGYLERASLHPSFWGGSFAVRMETLLVMQKVPMLVVFAQEISINECNDWGVQPGRPAGCETRAG